MTEGRTQLVGYAMHHRLVEGVTKARKMSLAELRRIVTRHREQSGDRLTIAQLESVFGTPADQWHGRCFEVATAAARCIGGDAVAVYGHYLGDVDMDGYWAASWGRPFIQHGWVRLGDGRILDPTRFSFENVCPYIFVVSIDSTHPDYDEGGNEWRRAIMRPAPVRQAGQKSVKLVTGPEIRAMLASTLGRENVVESSRHLDLSIDQIFWLANAPYDLFGKQVFDVYEAICASHGPQAIPIDNRRRAEREAGRKLPEGHR